MWPLTLFCIIKQYDRSPWSYNTILVPFFLNTCLSRFPCPGQRCQGSNPPRILFSGKKGSLGIPVKVTQTKTVIHPKIL